MSGNDSNRGQMPPKIWKLLAFVEMRKPLNGNLPHNSSSSLLQLDPLDLVYEGKATNQTGSKKDQSKIYSIRGFRGLLQQRILADMQEGGIEPCHSLSDKRYFSAQLSLTGPEET